VSDPADLYLQALTHSSWAHENPRADGTRPPDYQRLEFLGDAVLELCVRQLLLERYPDADEGQLTSAKQQLVRNDALPRVARRIRAFEGARLGNSMVDVEERHRRAVEADLVEALLGALYVDRGLGAAQEVVRAWFGDVELSDARRQRHPKTALQARARDHGTRQEDVCYVLLSVDGPSHQQVFLVAVCFADEEVGRGVGSSRKRAEVAAAEDALSRLDAPRPASSTPGGRHPKALLQERLHARGFRTRDFAYRVDPGDGDGPFKVTIELRGQPLGVGSGVSRRAAERAAAAAALRQLEDAEG